MRFAVAYMTVGTIVVGFLAIANVPRALMVPMLFAMPPNNGTVALAVSCVSVPIVCLLAIVVGWIVFAFRRRVAACCVLTILPALSFLAVATSTAVLHYHYGGRLGR